MRSHGGSKKLSRKNPLSRFATWLGCMSTYERRHGRPWWFGYECGDLSRLQGYRATLINRRFRAIAHSSARAAVSYSHRINLLPLADMWDVLPRLDRAFRSPISFLVC
jgi:hypothetical protein